MSHVQQRRTGRRGSHSRVSRVRVRSSLGGGGLGDYLPDVSAYLPSWETTCSPDVQRACLAIVVAAVSILWSKSSKTLKPRKYSSVLVDWVIQWSGVDAALSALQLSKLKAGVKALLKYCIQDLHLDTLLNPSQKALPDLGYVASYKDFQKLMQTGITMYASVLIGGNITTIASALCVPATLIVRFVRSVKPAKTAE